MAGSSIWIVGGSVEVVIVLPARRRLGPHSAAPPTESLFSRSLRPDLGAPNDQGSLNVGRVLMRFDGAIIMALSVLVTEGRAQQRPRSAHSIDSPAQ